MMNDSKNVMRAEMPSNEVSSDKALTMPMDSVSYIEQHWQKFLVLILLAFAIVWFHSEYKATMELRNEEASLTYSNARSLLSQLIMPLEVGKSENSAELLTRFLDEVKRLEDDFSDTPYASLGKTLSLVYQSTKVPINENSDKSSEELKEIELKLDTAFSKLNLSFDSKPLDRMTSELQILVAARSLITSQDPVIVGKGQDYLVRLLEKSEVFPVEASVSYLLSFDNQGEESFKEAMLKIHNLIIRYPQIEDRLVSELSRLGIYYDAESFSSEVA